MNASGIYGPHYDRNDNVEGFFVNAHAAMTGTHSEAGLLYSSYFPATAYDRVCFHFWYSLQHHQSIASVAVDSTSLEAATRRMWVLEEPESHVTLWNAGQVEIRSVDGLDFNVLFAVVRGAKDQGHFAVDDLSFLRQSNCPTHPSYAVAPNNELYSCTFDEGLCNWQFSSTGSYLEFEHVTAAEAEDGPEEDRLGYTDKKFVNLEFHETNYNTNAYLTSGAFEAERYKAKCFTFWYSAHVR